MEIVAFGLPFYFIAGLAYDPAAFFVYLAILIGKSAVACSCIRCHWDNKMHIHIWFFLPIAYKFALKMLYGVLAQVLPKKANVQGIGTFLYLLLTLTR